MTIETEFTPLIFDILPVKFNFVSPSHFLVVEIDDHRFAKSDRGNRSRVIPNILHILDHIDEYRAAANFYVSEEQMRVFPEVAALVVARGHELGICVDMHHNFCLSKIREIKCELESIVGRKTNGVFLKRGKGKSRILLRDLADTGFDYCLIDFVPRPPFLAHVSRCTFENGLSMNLLSPSKLKYYGIPIVFGDESKVRLFPLWFLRKCLKMYGKNGDPAIINFPLWEFDPHLPRKLVDPIRAIKNYGNLSVAEFKLKRLLAEFDFVSIPDALNTASVGG